MFYYEEKIILKFYHVKMNSVNNAQKCISETLRNLKKRTIDHEQDFKLNYMFNVIVPNWNMYDQYFDLIITYLIKTGTKLLRREIATIKFLQCIPCIHKTNIPSLCDTKVHI